MWVKIDDGFATHPKILAAGPLALAIQIRAICYASHNLTDGFLPTASIPILTSGLERISVETASVGDGEGTALAGFGLDADEIDWPEYMIEHGLWDRVDSGYIIHDYLEWNLSKKEYSEFIKKKSLAGKKGMKSRYNKEKSYITPVITKVITNDITRLSTATATDNLSSLTPNPKNDLKKSEDRFEEFWLVYPHKVGKGAARKAWAKIAPVNGLCETILNQVKAAMLTDQWTKDGGKFIPHPATWLNQSRWEDDYSKKTPIKVEGHFDRMAKLARGSKN